MENKINAVIANLGNGNVTTGNISIGDIHQENNITNENCNKFLRILEELTRETETLKNQSVKEALESIQKETTKKTSWNWNLIKFALDTIQKVGVSLAAKGMIALSSKAMDMLP